jgi:hypothetical protein
MSYKFVTNNLLALKWQDKREIGMLSTYNTPEMVPTEKEKRSNYWRN